MSLPERPEDEPPPAPPPPPLPPLQPLPLPRRRVPVRPVLLLVTASGLVTMDFLTGDIGQGVFFLVVFVGLPVAGVISGRVRNRRRLRDRLQGRTPVFSPARAALKRWALAVGGLALLAALAVFRSHPGDRVATGIIAGSLVAVAGLLIWILPKRP